MKATTYRLNPRFQEGLALLGQLRGVSGNRMVNEAVGEYLKARTAAVEVDLQETLRRVKAYREADPKFETAIAKITEAEAALGKDDPAEGTAPRSTKSIQNVVRNLIRG